MGKKIEFRSSTSSDCQRISEVRNLRVKALSKRATEVIVAIIVGEFYGIYEDDIRHDYDKENAKNFKEPDK